MITSYILASWVTSRKHGLITFVHKQLKWPLFINLLKDCLATEKLRVDVDGCKLVNIYKPPNSQLTPTAIPVFQHPCLYSGDFNCWHTAWGYNSISPDGQFLANGAAQGNLVLFDNPKGVPSFFAGC